MGASCGVCFDSSARREEGMSSLSESCRSYHYLGIMPSTKIPGNTCSGARCWFLLCYVCHATVLVQKFWLPSANTKPTRRDTSTSTPHNYAATSSIWSRIKSKCAQRTQLDICTTTHNHRKSWSWCDGARAGRGVWEVSQLHPHHHPTCENSRHNAGSTSL